jgi:hypothetical protein
MKIWKWELNTAEHQTIYLPDGAKILDVQMQGIGCCLWALCDDSVTTAYHPRNIAIYGTGNPLPDEVGEYIATFQAHGGSLVFHVFEVL